MFSYSHVVVAFGIIINLSPLFYVVVLVEEAGFRLVYVHEGLGFVHGVLLDKYRNGSA